MIGRWGSAETMDRVCIAVCVLIFSIAAGIHTSRRVYSDTAYFGGDTWEYQSMGVNIAKGHGPRFGGIEPFETYRFEPMDPEPPYKAKFLRAGAEGGDYNLFRTPGYPYFLGMIYAVAGVHPAAVKRIQALLVILVGSALPYLGFRFWGWSGFLGGLIASPAFLEHSRGMADEIATESLIVFAIFVMTLGYLRWSRVRSTASLALLGLSVGFALLVKGSLIFVPVLYLGHLLWSGRHDVRSALRRVLVFGCSVGVVVVPYSFFASVTDGRVIVLSTQGSVLLLQGNNELAVRTGGWEPRGNRLPGSFFKRADIEPLPPWAKVVRFYQAHPADLLEILPRKIDRGFGSFDYLRLLCWMLVSASVFGLLAGMRSLAGRRFLAVAAAAVAMAVGAGVAVQSGRVEISGLLLMTALVWVPAAYLRPRLRGLLPIPLVVYFVNFLMVTVIIFGHRRFTEVMDFLVILTAVAGTVWLCFEALRHLAGRGGAWSGAGETA